MQRLCVYLAVFNLLHPYSAQAIINKERAGMHRCSAELNAAKKSTLLGVIFNDEELRPDDFMKIVVETGDNYSHKDGFYKWPANDEADLPFQGWQFQISCDTHNGSEVAGRILPELQKIGVSYRMPDTDDRFFSKEEVDPASRGKSISIYPKDEAEAAVVAELVNRKLLENKIGSNEELDELLKGTQLKKEYVSLGKSGVFYVRYGRIHNVPKNSTNKTGYSVTVNGKTHFITPFSGINNYLVTPDGRTTEETRVAIPPWIEIPSSIKELMP